MLIAGMINNSILQGTLIIDAVRFEERFGSEEGFRVLLVDVDSDRADEVRGKLSLGLRDQGLEVVSASDPGTVINPQALEGQVEGAVMFGMGFALREQFHPDKTRTLKSYGLPTIRDIPEEVTILFVGEPLSIGPFGAKGSGEMSIIAPVPSIINAIANATGVRLFDIPATPGRVLEALTRR